MSVRARNLCARRGTFDLSVRDFTAGPDATAIVGRNGAGKSTLLLALQHLVPASGTIDVPDRRAAVFAQPALLRGSVRWNVERVLASARPDIVERRAAATKALQNAGLGGVLERDARRLSSGERQRLALARALAIEPHALFLDEPFANVDADGRPVLRALVRDYVERTGCALVVATQTLADVTALCAQLVLLEGGRDAVHSPADRLDSVDDPYLQALVGESRR